MNAPDGNPGIVKPRQNAGPVLLAVLAHPDDETFGVGGTLAYYAQKGVEVHLVCATRGEAGEVDPQYLEGFASIADRRESELRCAAGILGLTGVHFLGYRDSGMPGSPDNQHPQALMAASTEEVARQIVDYIRRYQPQVVLTFDPIGGYKHPDHIAVHRATLRAFQLAGEANYKGDLPAYQPQKLYYHLFPKHLLHLAVFALRLLGRDPRRFGRNGDIDLLSIVKDGNFPVHARIDCRSVEETRTAATACHVSQLGESMPRNGLLGWVMRVLGRQEMFMRAFPEASSGLRESDLFEGCSL
jgi:LmbE family N-acetylglucosaminyl deacetylase